MLVRLATAGLLLSALGCRNECDRNRNDYYGYVDTGYYGGDVYWDSGYRYWDSGYYREYYYGPTTLEIGLGVREFIEVTPYDPVVPEYAPDGSRNLRLALRTWGMKRTGLEVALQAFVGEERVAANSYVGVRMQCQKYGTLEATNLRLDLDPALLPPPQPILPEPEPEPFPEPIEDIWFDSAVDTGIYVDNRVDRSDVRITATLSEPNGGLSVTGETRWYLPR